MTMSAIKGQIQEDMKAALKAQDKARLAVIRLILAALKQKEVDERITLTDEHVLTILDKMIKQRRESIVQYESGNRPDLAKQEAFEISMIQQYLPAQLTDTEIAVLMDEAIKEAGAISPKDMGKVMAILKPKLQGRADIGAVSTKIKERLTNA